MEKNHFEFNQFVNFLQILLIGGGGGGGKQKRAKTIFQQFRSFKSNLHWKWA